jgi:hypothetical protein
MSSEHAKRTEAEMRSEKGQPFAVSMGILLNSDGVALGATNQQATPVMGSLANFSCKLLQSPDSKWCIGYISKLTVSKNRLLRHLIKKCDMKITRAKRDIEVFQREIDKEFWDLILGPIREANTNGVYLRLLSTPYNKALLVYPYVLQHIGDEPGQKRVCGMMEGNSLSFCIRCNYKMKEDGNKCNFKKKDYRSTHINKIKQLCVLSDNILFNSDDDVKQNELDAAKQLMAMGIHPGLHPFMNDCPRGHESNDIFKIRYDILHTFPGGVMKTLAFQCCVIIQSRGHDIIQLFDSRLATFPRISDCLPHVAITTFPNGNQLYNLRFYMS